MSPGDLPHIRVFISSPGDVAEERARAVAVVAQVQRAMQGRCVLEPYIWERAAMRAAKDFQEAIYPPRDCDIVVVVLWSRIGTPLPERYRREDGHLPTGTEWEFLDARDAQSKHGTPDMLVYRRTSGLQLDVDADESVWNEARAQRRAVAAFFERWFQDASSGAFTAAFNPYEDPDHFASLLATHLAELVDEQLEGRDRKVVWHGSPFKGLEAFSYEDALIFAGRRKAREELAACLAKQVAGGIGFVLVLGKSGSGKSSLVRAGLLPWISEPGGIDPELQGGSIRRAVLQPSRGQSPFHALAAALIEEHALPALAEGKGAGELARELTVPPTAVALIKHALDDRQRLALVVDQLEELFTAKDIAPDMRDRFIDVIDALARSGVVWVVATLRTDFYHHLQDAPRLMALKAGAGTYELALPGAAAFSEIIRHPAQLAGLRYERDETTGRSLDEVLASEASQAPDALPLLQFVLDQLYERKDGITLTHASYQSLGGLEGAIASRAEDVYQELPPSSQATLPRVFRQLVELGIEDRPTRRYAAKAQLTADPDSRRLVEPFVEARLFTTGGDEDSADVSVAHEALLRKWKRLQAWLDEDRELLAIRSRVEAGAAHWRGSSKDASLLLPGGKALDDARRLLTAGFELADNDRAYIQTSEDHERERLERDAERAKRIALWKRVGVTTVAILALVAGFLAVRATRAQREAEGEREIARQAETEANKQRAEALESERRAVASEGRAKAAQTAAKAALVDVLRLADAKKVRDLMDAESRLWPIHPDQAPAMTAWIEQAQALLARLPDHQRALATLRAKGTHAAEADAEARWTFSSEEEAWQHEVLAGVCHDLESMAAEDGLLAKVEARQEAASTLRTKSIDARAEAWTEVGARVRASKIYGHFALRPQLGLAPLGPDRDSGLEEFAHLGSGSMPHRGPDGKLVQADDACIVLVLLPAGEFLMGAQNKDKDGPNYDPGAEDDESNRDWQPVRVTLTKPFFLSKYELTQAQWSAMTGGATPSRYKSGNTSGGRAITARNPVERISWLDCVGPTGWLVRQGLHLPTEAQWEYACRASGKSWPWWKAPDATQSNPSDPTVLRGQANVADAYCRANGGGSFWAYTDAIDDGHTVHAPVGSYMANGFGLHDVHGNVWEWCRDAKAAYASGPVEDPLREGDGSASRVIRGGSWTDPAASARSANRYLGPPASRLSDLGVRPARPVTP